MVVLKCPKGGLLVHCCLVLCGQSFDAHFDIAAAVFCGLVFSKVLFHCLRLTQGLRVHFVYVFAFFDTYVFDPVIQGCDF